MLRTSRPHLALATTLALLLSTSVAMAQAPAAASPASAPAVRPAAAASAPPVAPRPPGALPPFAEITRDAKRAEGFLPIWTREERTWIEIPAEWLDKPFFFGASLASGLGDMALWPGLMGQEYQVVLRRVGNSVQLLARNGYARAPEGLPLSRAVAESYSDSLLASAPLVAAPHAQNKGLLIEAMALLGGDIGGLQRQLEMIYRLGYSLDRANSSVERAVTDARGLSMTVRGHYSVPRLPAPPVMAPGAPPPNPAALPNPPRVVPDARSLFLNVAYTLAPLPAQPMRVRRADQRVGYFTTSFVDFGNDTSEGRRTHFIERWRLEKKDPAAAISEPMEPIRAVMDRNIPEKWRAPVRDGILEWNKAFERAGFKNAIVVEQQAENADWSSMEGLRMLAVRWFAHEGPGAVAVGPSQSDPRTGEILRAAAIIPENMVRVFQSRLDVLDPRLQGSFTTTDDFAARYKLCDHSASQLNQVQFAFDLLTERGLIDPKGPEAERYIAQNLKDVTMHEIGHALGLRHNFRGSASVKPSQLRDARYTAEHGISNSVMDYNGTNLALDGEPTTDHHMLSLGAYDYWAIEWGYREFAPDQEQQELTRLASMSDANPALAYGTDEDTVVNDPLITSRDLGNDPLAFVQREVKLTHELWQRLQKRALGADDDMTIYRRGLQRGFLMLSEALPVAAKYIGGSYTDRALAGAGRPVVAPVPAVQQRAALELLVNQLFDTSSLKFDPRFMSRLGVNQLDRGRSGASPGVDFSLANSVAALQRGALDALMADGLAQRMADAETKVADASTLMSYADVQGRLQQAIWAELGVKGKPATGSIDSLRRTLQREHVRRLAGGLLRPTSTATADVRAVHRQVALTLQSRLKAALTPSQRWSATARAHLEDTLATVQEALSAPLAKQGV